MKKLCLLVVCFFSIGAFPVESSASDGNLNPLLSETFDQDSLWVEDTAEYNDALGIAMTVGDFDGNGYPDLAVSASGEDIGNDIYRAGAVNVFYSFENDGVSPYGDQFWHQDSDNILGIAERDDYFGSTLASGDFDDDGYDDLVVGVERESISGLYNAGMVHIIYGSDHQLTSDRNQTWHQNKSGIGGICQANDYFGAALAVGDFDDDGYDDLAIGVPSEDLAGVTAAGMVNVLYGSETGIRAARDQVWHQNISGISNSTDEYDNFGGALAAGDFNNDGYDDLAVSAYGENNSKGLVHIIFGSSDGLTSDFDQDWSLDDPGVAGTGQKYSLYGNALAAGDFDYDGYCDLAIGIKNYDVDGLLDSGAVSVLYGDSGGLNSNGSQFWTLDSPGILGEKQWLGRFGATLVAGDFDLDNRAAELAVWGRGLVEHNGQTISTAFVNIISGSWQGLTADGNVLLHPYTQGLYHPEVDDNADLLDSFGVALAHGNFDAKDGGDLVIGVPRGRLDRYNPRTGYFTVVYSDEDIIIE